MDKTYLMGQLTTALTIPEKWTVEKYKECPSSEFIVRTPCYAAFFSVVESSESLLNVYATAEKEIGGLKAMKGSQLPRDLELVLLVAGDHPPDPALVRKIADDRYVCRKFVLHANGGDIREILANLPFWPPDSLLGAGPTSTATGVQEALRGYDPHLIADLASRSPGVERIFEKIRENSYSLTGEPLEGRVVAPSRAAQSVQTRLAALEIMNFRGIRRLRPEDMPMAGDVIFIYGPNGVGKTSIADAVEWAISGQVSRLMVEPSRFATGGPDPIVNLFADNGEARVTCHLSSGEPVRRSKHGRSIERLIGSHGAADDRAVIDHVVGTKAPAPEARLRIERLRALFRGSHMLSQHDIRQFLELIKPTDRFDILTNMIGAEEFVRFREKAVSVQRHLRSHVDAIAEQSKSLQRKLMDVSTRLNERQKDFDKLSDVVTAGTTPEELASELLRGLRNFNCAIDEAAIGRSDCETLEHRSELIATRAETAIRTKKAAIEDLLVRLDSLEQEVQKYLESRARCASLAVEIARTKGLSNKARTELQGQEKARHDIQTALQSLRSKQSDATRRHANLTWLKENLPTHNQGREALRHTEHSLTAQREELQKSETTLEEQRKSLSVKRARLQEIEQMTAIKTSRERALADLLRRLPHVQKRRQETEQLSDRERQLNSRIGDLKREAASAREEVNAVQARLGELQRAYNAEATRQDELNSFLAKLGELVRSAECPLCGRGFPSTDEAKDGIRKHLSSVPIQLKTLARLIDEAKKEVEIKQAKADTIAAAIRTVEAESEEIRSTKTVATKDVQDFLAECIGSGVTVSGKDTVSWQNPIEEARKECEVSLLGSEAAGLRDAINSLVSRVGEQQSAVDELRRKLVHNEKERTGLIAAVQGLSLDMVQRGFEPGSLPADGPLSTELSKAQDEARESGESVTKKEAEFTAVDSTISGLRESIRRAEEDAASKENQLRQYETICSRFVATCRAVNVDPENPMESIAGAKERASELNQSLSKLDEKRQVLQQVASLGRLKLEIDALVQAEDDVKRQAEATSQEDSRLRDWVARMKGLEADVVTRQVDVVGSHLERLEPTTQRLYHRLNAHPIFDKVRIRVNEKTRELDIEAEASVAGEGLGGIAVSPSAFFSDAQLNSLAITIFLSGALRQRWSRFNTILIDDPVQQMDEMNVFAFLDLIRGLAGPRQFIIFTCNRDFYLLALEKLDCLNKSKRGSFLAYRLEGIAPSELKVSCDVH